MRVERALVGILCVITVAGSGCGGRLAYNLPPASRLAEPGPGVGGPGPGIIPPAGYPNGMYGGAVGRFGDGMGTQIGGGYETGYGGSGHHDYMGANAPRGRGGNGVMQASYNCGCENGACSCGESCPCGSDCGEGCCPDDGGAMPDGTMDGGYVDGVAPAGFHHGHGGPLGGLLGHHGFIRPGSTESYADGAMAGPPTSQIAFLGDDGITVSWDVSGYGMFDSDALVIPARQDFYQGAIYRLRISNVPGRSGVELYPTLEIAPVTPRTDAYLAHSPIPVQFTEEDFDQVLSGNFVTKVIYLPDPEFQELALAGVETLVSTRLDPGVDPIAEADRRGSILAILRMGNKDLRGGGMSQEYDYEPDQVVPASHTSGGKSNSYESQALYNEELNESGQPMNNSVEPAQYYGPYGDGSMGGMPVGMPTRGFAPPNVPPNMLAGGPQWGMPITGTPIGLPGPPHVPLGVPAGLQQHVMKNRTRVLLPQPVAKVKLSVKQRPGLNYPRPVNHVTVDETQREPLRLIPGWFSGLFKGGAHGGPYGNPNCQ